MGSGLISPCADQEWNTWARSSANTFSPAALRAEEASVIPQNVQKPPPTRGGGNLSAFVGRHPTGRNYRNERSWIVAFRSGPTPTAEIGAPDMSSSART